MKNVLIVFLIFAYMNCYFGCTTSKKMIITDKEVDTETNDDELIIMIKDSTCYLFEANMYRFENDSLDGIATIYGEEHKQRMKIALRDIIGIGDVTTETEVKEIEWGTIGWIVGGIVIVSVIIVGVLFSMTMSEK